MRYGAELAFACARAAELGRLQLAIAEEGFFVGTKDDGSKVTRADVQANKLFIDAVAEEYPDDGVLGEELSRPANGPRTWVIDPLDGTQQYIQGVPAWMVAIALVLENGTPVLGVAHNPSARDGAGRMYWATAGGGAFRDGRPLKVSKRDRVAGTVLVNARASTGAPPTCPARCWRWPPATTWR